MKGGKTHHKRKNPSQSNPKSRGKTTAQKRSAYPGLGQNAQHKSPGGSPKKEKKPAIKVTKSLPTPVKKQTTTLNLAIL